MVRTLSLLLISCFSVRADDLMPRPAQMTPGDGKLIINESFRVALSGEADERVQAAARRLVARLARKTGIPLRGEPVASGSPATFTILCAGPGQKVQQLGEDESYRLVVTPQSARLEAPNPLGVLRAIETFLQWVEIDKDAFVAPAVDINDRARFPWRGLLIDVGRHFIPMEVMKRNIDGMAAVKLNVLHWHLTDDQGFRVESKRYPRLHTMGSDGDYFTQDQVREILAYARERGIRVVPEFDIPGHTTAWFPGHPELASGPGPYQIERTWGIHNGCIDPTREQVYEFLDGFIGEMAALFPDAFFHIGGDEVNGREWNANARITEFKKSHGMKDNHDLQAYFNQRILAIVKKHGKIMMGWDEILHPSLPKDILVHSWRGQKSLAAAAREGYRGLLSFGYYLDLIQPASYHYSIEPMSGDAATLSEQEKTRILGGEACMWAEYVSAETIDSRIWPRAAAVAERLWSPQDVTDVPSMYRRMNATSRELEQLGLTHRSSYREMLERIAGDRPVGPLEALSGLLEPVKGYARGRGRNYTQSTPLNRLVDATRPESDAARQFAQMVDRVISGGREPAAALRQMLARWREIDQRLAPEIQDSYLLQEAAPLAKDLAAASAVGLEALDYLTGQRRPSPEWVNQQADVLARAKQSKAELLIMVVPSIERLVQAAGK